MNKFYSDDIWRDQGQFKSEETFGKFSVFKAGILYMSPSTKKDILIDFESKS